MRDDRILPQPAHLVLLIILEVTFEPFDMAVVFEGESHVEWFEGNFQDYEKDKMRRLGQDSIIPHRVKYKKLTR